MADTKITELVELTSFNETDLLPIVANPGSVPVTQKIALKTVLDKRLNYSITGSDFALTAGTGLQSAFPTTGDVFTLVASTTYQFSGTYYISKSVGSCTTALAFALAGGASITSIKYRVLAQNGPKNVTSATVASTWIDTVASTVINAAATTEVAIEFTGIIRMNAGGTVTPQIQFSAAPTTPLMTANSFIMFTPIGTTNNVLGTVS